MIKKTKSGEGGCVTDHCLCQAWSEREIIGNVNETAFFWSLLTDKRLNITKVCRGEMN
jgi:hypothetical protein